MAWRRRFLTALTEALDALVDVHTGPRGVGVARVALLAAHRDGRRDVEVERRQPGGVAQPRPPRALVDVLHFFGMLFTESFFDLALLDPRRRARGLATARAYRVD